MTRYRHRAGELLVHADDCAALGPALAGFGYHPAGASGAVHRFTGTRPVPEVLAALGSRGASPNHLFGPDRIIWGELRPKPTNKTLDPVLAPDVPPLVGMIDTGVVLHEGRPHPFLGNRVVFDPEDTVRVVRGEDGNPVGSAAHGSFVAGVLLKQVPPEVRVRVKGVIDEQSGELEDLAVANAIDELREEGITLINLSFSGATWEGEPPKAIEAALSRLPADSIVVASAGNRASRQRVYPAGIKFAPAVPGSADPSHVQVIAVGSADASQDSDKPRVTDFSNYGPWVSAYADGVDVLGPYFRPGYPTEPAGYNGFAVWSGTSFSAAIVTGQIAAVMTKGASAFEAAGAVLHPEGVEDPVTVRVQDLNGEAPVPYVAGVREPGA
ncbi:S8 family peptidase [Amycolatopsis eburnea]|uniref:Serine protease n=1 Tax=Amycolatopsis eburnea TaxID=2267691 RepID=A0A427T7V8_9PSEU|nr:S8 family serine peptidase [Amycolatopsis eburnea]RSD16454.1 serine protease [Amycolatopsis eburnea]